MKELTDLLPCPFCGGPAELDTRQGYTYAHFGKARHGTAVAVYCTECAVQISVCREDVPDIAPEAVIEMWNRRAASPASPAMPSPTKAAMIEKAAELAEAYGCTIAYHRRCGCEMCEKDLTSDGLALRTYLESIIPEIGEAVAWTPAFDAMSVEQEHLAVQFCAEIAGPRGKKGSPPDPVRLLEMAEALYQAERHDCGPSAPPAASPPLISKEWLREKLEQQGDIPDPGCEIAQAKPCDQQGGCTAHNCLGCGEAIPAASPVAASEPLGRCCYGGIKTKRDCASCAAWEQLAASPPQGVLKQALEALGEMRPMTAYGVVGSRDVDQARYRKVIDAAIASIRSTLSAEASQHKAGAVEMLTTGEVAQIIEAGSNARSAYDIAEAIQRAILAKAGIAIKEQK